MQSEFINIAAHKLRTPIQPILGLTEVIRTKIGDREEESELLNVVSRNAKRLQQLTENILDVTNQGKKEGQDSLELDNSTVFTAYLAGKDFSNSLYLSLYVSILFIIIVDSIRRIIKKLQYCTMRK
jgi:signal transduction histidine kinase